MRATLFRHDALDFATDRPRGDALASRPRVLRLALRFDVCVRLAGRDSKTRESADSLIINHT